MNCSTLLLYCRPGFENECAAEITEVCAESSIYGYVKTKTDSAYVLFNAQTPISLDDFNDSIRYKNLIFARQLLFIVTMINDLSVKDRITPLLESIQPLQMSFNDVWLETTDTNEGKQLSNFCKKFSTPFTKALNKAEKLDVDSYWRLHLMFLSSSSAYIALSGKHNSANLLMGIPRLRMPRSAPSRSTLKLDEAINFMLRHEERDNFLANGMTAVDLGACPGGWTWQLVNRGIRVIAVDNGSMDQALMDTGLVKHKRADGFKFRPEEPVDWLVCDMVERPLHITRLMTRWLTEGLTRHAIFNLKLPMKKRYPMVIECQQLLSDALRDHNIKFDLRMKQLYHDREEITCVVLTRGK